MGPLELSDLVGLDVRRDILNGLADSFDDNSYRPHRLLDSLVSEGSLGKKLTREYIIGRKMGKKKEMIYLNEVLIWSAYSSNQLELLQGLLEY